MACPDEVSGKVRREKCSPVPLPPKLEKCATSLRKLKWTAEMTHCLIEKVRGRPVLWDHNHELFNKIIYKKLKWREVADDLQQLFPELLDYGLAEDDVQKKFGTLKSTFQREVRKRLQYPEGSITSRWEYFKTCSFMLGLINNETSKLSYSVYPSQVSF
ncbi:hypothetical protein SK128_003341 [Halocaridina rubra]|uniref:MADF domain-containing protein n=1 Tax=Halocaridina rubra TaxID=373956 RepID=A0AAN8WN79_HALRR